MDSTRQLRNVRNRHHIVSTGSSELWHFQNTHDCKLMDRLFWTYQNTVFYVQYVEGLLYTLRMSVIFIINNFSLSTNISSRWALNSTFFFYMEPQECCYELSPLLSLTSDLEWCAHRSKPSIWLLLLVVQAASDPSCVFVWYVSGLVEAKIHCSCDLIIIYCDYITSPLLFIFPASFCLIKINNNKIHQKYLSGSCRVCRTCSASPVCGGGSVV